MSESDQNSTERFRRLSALLDEALTLPIEQRADFVARCRPEDLRAELAALLALDDRTGPLDRPPHALAGDALRSHKIGRYHLHEPLGEGGMATVWRAGHTEAGFSRQVALKCLKAGLATPELRARFLREQQILAGLEHPNIARLYDAGISGEGVPFIVMELIDGVPITEYCERQRLSIRARLKLFRKVLDAVACAHQNLIVHRDLKPANILVSQDGHPRLLDFGIAKALDEADEATRTQMRALTPGYAAPEQFRGDTVTTATDVYALGVVLHELLTGTRPERDTDIDPAIAPDPPLASQAVTGEPDDTAKSRGIGDSRRLAHVLRGDLDTLIAGALRPDPARRYRDAAALDAEIERYLNDLPLNVRRDRRAYRTAKFLRRNWLAVGAVTGIAAALIVGAGMALWQAGQARFEAERATAALNEAEQALRRAEALQEFLLDLFRSAQPDRPRDQLPTTEEILALGAERAMDEESAPPAERFAMLQTLGTIYGTQNRRVESRQLIEAAVALAREHQDQRPEDLAQALFDLALVVMAEGDLTESENLLLEAESLVGDSDEHWNIYANARTWRAWGERLKGNYKQALNLLEPVYVEMRKGREVNDALREQIVNFMAVFSRALGDLETAADLFAEFSELTKLVQGSESRDYAISLANSAGVEHDLGRFKIAEARTRQAISLHDRIFDQPVEYRASARRSLAWILLSMGRIEEALSELDAAITEWALARDKDPETWEHRFHLRGRMLADLSRWPEAEADLKQARRLFASIDDDQNAIPMTIVDALLAQTLCLRNKTAEGETVLSELDARLEESSVDARGNQALIHTARATCALGAGRMEEALREIDRALALDSGYPGRVVSQNQRQILRAFILAALGRHDEAALELDLAEQVFLDLDLSDHPHYSSIETTRQELGFD